MQNLKYMLKKTKIDLFDELVELLKIPSISADSAYKKDLLKTAEAVKASLKKAGCDRLKFAKLRDTQSCMAKKS